jgi:hypothetical protein
MAEHVVRIGRNWSRRKETRDPDLGGGVLLKWILQK